MKMICSSCFKDLTSVKEMTTQDSVTENELIWRLTEYTNCGHVMLEVFTKNTQNKIIDRVCTTAKNKNLLKQKLFANPKQTKGKISPRFSVVSSQYTKSISRYLRHAV